MYFQNECSFNWYVNSKQPDGLIYHMSGKYILSTNLENIFELRRAFDRLRMHTLMYATDRLFLMDIYTTTSFTVGHLLLYNIGLAFYHCYISLQKVRFLLRNLQTYVSM